MHLRVRQQVEATERAERQKLGSKKYDISPVLTAPVFTVDARAKHKKEWLESQNKEKKHIEKYVNENLDKMIDIAWK